MRHKTLLTIILAWLAIGGGYAQNPIVHNQFSADPTARVFNGRLYLFPSHDIHYSVNPASRPEWFCMADYHVFSTDNMTDWTDHGVILSQEQVPWGNPKGYSMWAPDCVEKDGKYYFFFPDGVKPVEGQHMGGFGIGVAIGDKPYGPYVPQAENIKGISGIDPCVLQTSKGENYIYWGAGGLYVAKMKDNLLELIGDSEGVIADSNSQRPSTVNNEQLTINNYDYQKTKVKGNSQHLTPNTYHPIIGGKAITELPKAGLQEGPFAFERNGKFYLTYPWVRYNKGDKDENGKVLENPTEALVYAMSDNPMGPWEYKGVIMKEHENGCWTNHHSIVEFNGQWYLFYHHNDYSPKFDKNRSVCVDSLHFNADGTIQEVRPTLRGVGVTDARGMVQMDRYSNIGGGATIAYNDTTNYFLGWKTVLPKGGWVSYGNVQMENGKWEMGNGSSTGSENQKVWVCMPGWFGRMQLVDISKTTLELKVNKQTNGLAELVLMNKGEQPVEVDWISLSDRQPLVPSTSGGLSTGSYRNLFVEAGYAPEAVEKKLQEVFDGVFTGKNKCYFETTIPSANGGGKVEAAYISDIKNDDVRTEGMSYGMMIAVQFDRKDIFDKLWRWAKHYMQIKEGGQKGYFRWTCKCDGSSNEFTGPASDGELYFITSLIFASNRWGNTGEIDYLKEAQYILDAVQPHEMEFTMHRGMDGKPLEKPVTVKRTISLIDPETKLITFVPGMNFTDPSYHIPAFYEVWARYADDGRASYWRECAKASREYLHRSIHPMTGLTPDYNNYDGTLMNRGGIIGDAFRYDSWRVPMNIALDYSWSCSDKAWQQEYGHKIQNFLYAQGIDSFVDQYNIDGTTPDKILKAGNYPEKLRHSVGLVGTAAAASILCSHPKAYEFIDQLWDSKHEKDADGYIDEYYDGLIRLFAFMHLSGHYRVIEKTPQLESYLKLASKEVATPDAEGFIHRWMLRNPISKPNNTNTVFVDSYLNETFPTAAVANVKQYTALKKNKDWTLYDSQLYHAKLYRLATCTKQQRYGVIFWASTVVECDEDMEVRFAIGSNSASKWWLNGQEAALLSGDRRMVRDDIISKPVTLKKGKNVITGAIINGPGMSDFCFRLIDKEGKKPILTSPKGEELVIVSDTKKQ